MALLLAPYNDAMRLGMGFNSFTQQLCVNDVVRLAGGKQETATDKSLRPQYQLGLMTAPDGSNVDISQNVTWTAKFVDKMSEVTNSLNVSGSLQVKLETGGAGVDVSASFLDGKKFKESDINYFIQVRVTNQHLTAPDLTDFAPIPNVPFSEFNRVYGDSFISGFIEGGEFNALISIKLNDSSQATRIRGDLAGSMGLDGIQVSAKASLDKEDVSSNIDGETTISVSWKGGGDIKDATVTDWTLDTLKHVAIEFPEHVMACPMRTYAILTKYTSLKNYENAGVYSSALLDAYMDYKVMWRDIQQVAWEVEKGQCTLTAKEVPPKLAELKAQAKEYYDKQMSEYQQKQQALQAALATSDPATDPNVTQPVPQQTPATVVPAQQALHDAPMPPNNLVPYDGDQFGLDQARRDCRFEMIKIVKEVDTVAVDPRVACDPSRTWQYLSPVVFRMLLPFEIRPVGARAFSIHHLASGLSLTTGNTVANGVDFTFGAFPTFFAFQDMKNGAAMIHIAETPEYTMAVWGVSMDNGGVVRGWSGPAKGENSQWYIKDFADHNI
ncbi:hypothetical protein MVEN_01171800 [Mycena venus]|uniref:Uncharacterized protein n=1 Tax=Mycena venus TaxID=2733690 RepID=A0A8H7CVQ6_9AGAR|nr:hypothetical protein MVEN_01171800 [Mycena venus]